MRIQDLTELTSLADTDLVVVDDYQSAGVYNTKKMTVANLKTSLNMSNASYTKLVFNLSQNSTNAPTLSEFENTTGASITTSRVTTGTYSITFDNAILTDFDKVHVLVNNYKYPYAVSCSPLTSTVLQVQTWIADSATATDGGLNRASFEIKIYN